ncbi:MAG: hypothetical protein EOP34_09965, partial [Rickettsiales bacterium]
MAGLPAINRIVLSNFKVNMNPKSKTKILLVACVLIVSTLSLIQYYLVKNTYQLTKDKYYAEVQIEFGKILTMPAVAAAEAKVIDHLKQIASG